jgi:hypothetical protein
MSSVVIRVVLQRRLRLWVALGGLFRQSGNQAVVVLMRRWESQALIDVVRWIICHQTWFYGFRICVALS